jgi:predicted RecB family nuclease
VRHWVNEAGFMSNVAAKIADFLEELGASTLEDLADLEENDIKELIDLVPRIKKAKFKAQLANYNPRVLKSKP